MRQFDEAAEWACDRAATAGQPRATDYARALVRLGEAATRQASYSPAAHGRTLAVRVRRILSSATQEDSVMKKTLLIAAAAALVAVGLVRLELVAREPAVDGSIVADADQVPGDEAPTKETRNLLAQATNAALDAQTKAAKGDNLAAAEAAGKAFEAFQAAYETDSATLADLCNWSQRWHEAERKVAKTANDHRAAGEAYLARTQAIHDKVKALYVAGARGGEAEKYYSMVFYLEEAKEMVRTAGRRTDTGAAKPATNPTDAKSGEVVTRLDPIERERLANVGKDPRSLRFDGRSFEQWREELLTELKPERRTEAILAFRAFAVNGLGREAAQAVVDVMRGHDVWMNDDSPEGRLKNTALQAFATIDRTDAVPVLVAALKDGNANQRLFAARVLSLWVHREKDAAAALIAAVSDKDAHVRQSAIAALAMFDPRPAGAAAAMVTSIGDKDAEAQQQAIYFLAADDPRPEGLVPALRKSLKHPSADVVIAAIHALVPPQPGEGFGGTVGGVGLGGGMGGGVRLGGGMFGGGGQGDALAFATRQLGRAGQGNQQAPARVGPEPIFVPEFLKLVDHANVQVATAAYSAIYTLGAKAKPALPNALECLHRAEYKNRVPGYAIIAAIGPEAKYAVGDLIKIVEDPQRDLQETLAAIETLGAIGPAAKEANEAIMKAGKRLAPLVSPPGNPEHGPEGPIQVRQAIDKINPPPEKPKAKDAPDPNAQSSAKDRAQQQQRVWALIQVKANPGTLPALQRPDLGC